MKKNQTTLLAFCFLCIFCGLAAAQTNVQPTERHRYKIDIKIDFDNLSYTGTETVHWVNQGEKPTSVIYYHLYPNLRVGDQPPRRRKPSRASISWRCAPPTTIRPCSQRSTIKAQRYA